MSYRQRCKRSRLYLLSVFEQMPSLHTRYEIQTTEVLISWFYGRRGSTHLERRLDRPCSLSAGLHIPSQICRVDVRGWLDRTMVEWGDARLELCLFVCEFVVDCTFDLTCLLQQLNGESEQ